MNLPLLTTLVKSNSILWTFYLHLTLTTLNCSKQCFQSRHWEVLYRMAVLHLWMVSLNYFSEVNQFFVKLQALISQICLGFLKTMNSSRERLTYWFTYRYIALWWPIAANQKKTKKNNKNKKQNKKMKKKKKKLKKWKKMLFRKKTYKIIMAHECQVW